MERLGTPVDSMRKVFGAALTDEVRSGSLADLWRRLSDVCFTPKSGHWNRHAYHLRRSNSGSFVIFAAIPPRAYPTALGYSIRPVGFLFCLFALNQTRRPDQKRSRPARENQILRQMPSTLRLLGRFRQNH